MRQRWEGWPLLPSWPGLKRHQRLAPAQAVHRLSTLPGGTKKEDTRDNGTEMDAHSLQADQARGASGGLPLRRQSRCSLCCLLKEGLRLNAAMSQR